MIRPEPTTGWSRSGVRFFSLACLALVCLFDGPWLFSSRVGVMDWPKELFYFHYLLASLTQFGELPATFFTIPDHLTHFSTLQDLSYWSNPEVISFSPFLPLAWLLPPMGFIKAYFGLHFVLGIAGTGLLARRLGLSPHQGALLFALLAMNPWLTQHLAIGYSPAINTLLLPGVAALLLGGPGRPLELALAALGNAMAFYQGALHLFVWFNAAALLTAALAGTHHRSLAPLARVAWFQALTFALIFPKYWAVRQVYDDFVRYPGTGYASWADLWGLLTDAESPLFDFPATLSRHGVAFYDASLCVGAWFMGLAGLAALTALAGRGRGLPGTFPLWVPAAACAVCVWAGWGDHWFRLTNLITPLRSEIYPFRWLYPAYLLAAVFVLCSLARLSARLRPPWEGVLLWALFLPTLFWFHERNDYFNGVNTYEEDTLRGFSLREYLFHRVTAFAGETRLKAAASPASGLVIIPPGSVGDVLDLAWLAPRRLGEYRLEGLAPGDGQGQEGTRLTVTVEGRPVALHARTHSRGLLWPLGVGVFALMAWASLAVARRGRRPGRAPLPDR